MAAIPPAPSVELSKMELGLATNEIEVEGDVPRVAVTGHDNVANGQGKSWWLPAWSYNPRSDEATIGFITKVADASTVGHGTLLTIFVMYLWAWAKPGAACIPKLIPKFNGTTTEDSKYYVPSIMQVLVIVIPFFVFPVEVSISGMARALKDDRASLGSVASLCLAELFVSVILGAAMLACVTGWSVAYIGLGTAVVAILLVLGWSLSFKHPKCLRTLIWSKCFRQAAEVANQGAEGGVPDADNH